MSCAKVNGLSAIFKHEHSIINELEENRGFDPDSITLTAILQSQNVCKFWNFFSPQNTVLFFVGPDETSLSKFVSSCLNSQRKYILQFQPQNILASEYKLLSNIFVFDFIINSNSIFKAPHVVVEILMLFPSTNEQLRRKYKGILNVEIAERPVSLAMTRSGKAWNVN